MTGVVGRITRIKYTLQECCNQQNATGTREGRLERDKWWWNIQVYEGDCAFSTSSSNITHQQADFRIGLGQNCGWIVNRLHIPPWSASLPAAEACANPQILHRITFTPEPSNSYIQSIIAFTPGFQSVQSCPRPKSSINAQFFDICFPYTLNFEE